MFYIIRINYLILKEFVAINRSTVTTILHSANVISLCPIPVFSEVSLRHIVEKFGKLFKFLSL